MESTDHGTGRRASVLRLVKTSEYEVLRPYHATHTDTEFAPARCAWIAQHLPGGTRHWLPEPDRPLIFYTYEYVFL